MSRTDQALNPNYRPEIIFKVLTEFFDQILSGEKTLEWRGWSKWAERLDGPGYVGPVTAVFLDFKDPSRPPHKREIKGWSIVPSREAPRIARRIYPMDGSFYRIELGRVVA